MDASPKRSSLSTGLRNAYAGGFRRKATFRTGETTGKSMLDGCLCRAINFRAVRRRRSTRSGLRS